MPFDVESLTPSGGPVWLRVGTLLDGTSHAPLRDAHVVYDATEIRFVGTEDDTPPRHLLRAGQQQPDVDAPEYTLLPGLTDAHAHLFLDGAELDPEKRSQLLGRTPAEVLARASERLAGLVRSGVIAVRDAGDNVGVGIALSALNRSAERPLMPYVDSPGAAIHRRGRYGSFMGQPIEDHASHEECVAARVAAGADRIKLIATGIIDFRQGRMTSEPQFSSSDVARISVAARAAGRQTFAHASGDAGIDCVIDGGIDSVEHGYFIRDDQLARMRDERIAWVPTMAPLHQQIVHADLLGRDAETVGHLRRILDAHAASLRKAHEMGVLVVAGSDAGSYGVAHGAGLWLEMALMERAGLPPVSVVNSATGIAADRLGFSARFGRIASGFLPRLILTKSPLSMTNGFLGESTFVVFDGAAYCGEVRARAVDGILLDTAYN